MLKNELRKLYQTTKELDLAFTELKVALHNVDKMGLNVEEIYKQVDELGKEVYKTKNIINDKIKEVLK